jgi:hypothetical protein
VLKSHYVWKLHSACTNQTLRVAITLCMYKSHSACGNHTVRKQITLVLVFITVCVCENYTMHVNITLCFMRVNITLCVMRVNITLCVWTSNIYLSVLKICCWPFFFAHLGGVVTTPIPPPMDPRLPKYIIRFSLNSIASGTVFSYNWSQAVFPAGIIFVVLTDKS